LTRRFKLYIVLRACVPFVECHQVVQIIRRKNHPEDKWKSLLGESTMDEASAADEMAKSPPVRVFISYAWEDDDYKVLVNSLARRLREDGVNARLDQWHLEGLTIPEFMDREVRLANKVLVVCSPQYREKVHAMEEGKRITGTGWESMLVTSRIWASADQRNKIVAVLLRGAWREAAPDFIIALPYIDLSNMAQFEVNYRELLRSLTGQREQAPRLGRLPQITPEPIEPLHGPAQPLSEQGALEKRPSLSDSLPSFSTSFAGREREIAGCIEALNEHRWITLTGMGGVGKTRLPVELGRRMRDAFEDGVLFVGLVHARNSEQAVLSALAVTLNENGLEVKGDNEKALVAALKNRYLLLIFDNFEAVMDAALVPARILQRCSRLRLIVTSQTPLDMSAEGEHEWRVEPMATPQPHHSDNLEQLAEIESFKLFRQRAGAVKKDWDITSETFPLVKDILNLTEGIPLSVELAAAQIGDRSLIEISRGIKNRLDFLWRRGRALDQRHASIAACLDWSFNLLPTDAQTLFPQLSVFHGGFFVEDVEQVCQIQNAANLLITLKDRSLLLWEERLDRSRYRMLGTVQDYASSKLGEEKIPLERRHAQYFLEVLKSADRQFKSAEHLAARAQISAELENIFAGVNHSREANEHRALVENAFSLSDYLQVSGRFAEGLDLAASARSAAETLKDNPLVAACDNNLGNAYCNLPTGDRGENLTRAIACYKAALRGYQAVGATDEVRRLSELIARLKRGLPQS
jgi:predicted ATPase